MLDDRVRAFVKQHPDAVVVDLGAGLDSGVYRVGPPPTVDWYSVDLPGITALRDEVLPGQTHSHTRCRRLWPTRIGPTPSPPIARRC